MLIVTRRVKTFINGGQIITIDSGIVQSVPDWVRETSTYQIGMQDESIREVQSRSVPATAIPALPPTAITIPVDFPDLRPFFKCVEWRAMPHSGGVPVGSDFTDKAASDPVFGVFKRCGFWTTEEVKILFDLARSIGGAWLDIGGLTGWTAAHLVKAGCRVYSVDPMYANAEFRARAEENLKSAGVADSVSLWACTSSEFLMKVKRQFDGIVIDGDHESPGPLNDVSQSAFRVSEGGPILLHDTKMAAVREASESLARLGWARQEFPTTHGVTLFRRAAAPIVAGPEFIAPAGTARGSDDRVIVSADIGNHYADEFRVTKANCNRYCADSWRIYHSDYPKDCPPHNLQMYAFKLFAMEEAIRAGFRYILWMDSSLAPLASIEPLWKIIKKQGYYAAPQYDGDITPPPRHWSSKIGATLGTWCSDSALGVFGISRQEAFEIPLALTGLVGLDMRNPIAQKIWDMHKTFYARGVFNGAHQNVRGQQITPSGNGKFIGHVSDDPRVHGHRHDETSFSFALHKLGLKPVNLGFWTLESPSGFIGQFTHRFGLIFERTA
jgi:predicted O-methyltransferase YrrM